MPHYRPASTAVAATFAGRNRDDHAVVGEWLGALSADEQAEAARLLHRVLTSLPAAT